MKKYLQILIIGAASTILASVSMAQKSRFDISLPSPNGGVMLIPPSTSFSFLTVPGWFTPTPPVIDGNLDDYSWTFAERGNFDPSADGNKGLFKDMNTTFAGTVTRKMLREINFTSQSDYNSWTGRFTSTPYPAEIAGHSGSFGILWDTTYLYLGVNIINPKFVAAAVGATFNNMNVEVFFNSQWPIVTYAATNDNYDLSKSIFPRLYNNDHDSQISMFARSKTTNPVQLRTSNLGWVNYGGIAFSDNNSSNPDFEAVVKPTSYGYIFEAKCKWSKINQGYMNILDPEKYDDPSKKPKPNRQIGFDIGFNVSDGVSDDDKRNGFLTWNTCCLNRSWSESFSFGTLRLQGEIVSSPAVTGLTVSGANISAPLAVSLMSVDVDPVDASKDVTWSVSGATSGGAPIAVIDQLGVLRPLNNGVVTVTATSKRSPTVSASKIINVSGQVAVSSLTVDANDINTNWGSSTFSATASPNNAPAQVTWSIVSGGNLGTLNTATGVFIANALASGTLTVRATSLADPTKTADKSINVSQFPISSITIGGFAPGSNVAINPCRTQTAMTIGGYALNDKINIAAYYKRNETDSLRVVPSDLMNFTLKKPGTANSKLEKTSSSWELTIKDAISIVSISGVYLNDPSITTEVRTRLQSSAPVTCAGVTLTETSSSLDDSEWVVYPNPASDLVIVSADLKQAGSATVSIVNQVGTVVSSTSAKTVVGKNQISSSVAGLAPGVYFLKVTLADGQSATKKFVVSK